MNVSQIYICQLSQWMQLSNLDVLHSSNVSNVPVVFPELQSSSMLVSSFQSFLMLSGNSTVLTSKSCQLDYMICLVLLTKFSNIWYRIKQLSCFTPFVLCFLYLFTTIRQPVESRDMLVSQFYICNYLNKGSCNQKREENEE